MNIDKIKQELDENRRSVSFDSYDITIRQLIDMILENAIDISPEYQRHFVWDDTRQSQLIESIFLGIPVPSLFMATNKDSTWEVIDGVQRLTTLINFICSEEEAENILVTPSKSKLSGLEKLGSMNGLFFEDLPKSIQLMLLTRPIRLTVLNDKSDFNVRYDLFERLNTGGVILHPQEIRNCVYLGEFNDFIKECAQNKDFRSVVKTTENAERSGSFEELVLRFFAYLEDRQNFVHSVQGFLNDYMKKKTLKFKNKKELNDTFNNVFKKLNSSLPDGIVRGNRKNITPVILYEAISIGTALSLTKKTIINKPKLVGLLNDPELKKYTTGATNNKKTLMLRIDYVRDELLK